MMKPRLVRVLIFFGVILFTINIFPQGMKNIAFINELADRDEVTLGHAVRFFLLTVGAKTQSFERNIRTLNRYGIMEGITIEKDKPLSRGTLALMIARYLDLKGSLLYITFNIGRYAYRACVAEGIMHYSGSEWDLISGGELIEIMSIVSNVFRVKR